MDFRDLFHQIGTTYDRHLGMRSDAQLLLRDSSKEILEPLVPAGYVIKGSGGQGAGAHVPWIAVFNPDETTKAQHGMYVVYLFRADMQVVYLSLEQGVTELVDLHGRTRAREILASQALAIRANMPTLQSYLAQISLGVKEDLPLDYEAGNIGALEYSLSNLPSAQQLADDLDQMLLLYENALEVETHFESRCRTRSSRRSRNSKSPLLKQNSNRKARKTTSKTSKNSNSSSPAAMRKWSSNTASS